MKPLSGGERTGVPESRWVVVPTYNEADNIERLVEAIQRRAGPDERILVVDDNSPDGTGRIADRLAEGSDSIEVLHREGKAGLGSAYVAGFGKSLSRGASRVVQMDADFSHDPALLSKMFEASREADLVLGSRYVEGGGITEWGRIRRLLSKGGNLYARAVLGLSQRDLTGGFKCWRAEALRAIDFGSITSTGYAFQVELTYRAVEAGLTVIELPIIFSERTEGESKMSGGIVAEAVVTLPTLRFRSHSRRG